MSHQGEVTYWVSSTGCDMSSLRARGIRVFNALADGWYCLEVLTQGSLRMSSSTPSSFVSHRTTDKMRIKVGLWSERQLRSGHGAKGPLASFVWIILKSLVRPKWEYGQHITLLARLFCGVIIPQSQFLTFRRQFPLCTFICNLTF